MKYWGRAILVYLGITAALYGTNLVKIPETVFTGWTDAGITSLEDVERAK